MTVYQAKKWFQREKFMVDEVCYPEDSDIPRSNMRGSTVLKSKIVLTKTNHLLKWLSVLLYSTTLLAIQSQKTDLLSSNFCHKVSNYHNQHGLLVNESGYFWHPLILLLQVVYIYICLQAECLFQMEKVMEHVRANSLSGQTELPLLVDRLLSKFYV